MNWKFMTLKNEKKNFRVFKQYFHTKIILLQEDQAHPMWVKIGVVMSCKDSKEYGVVDEMPIRIFM